MVDSQTPNACESLAPNGPGAFSFCAASGPFLVSRTGAAGCTECVVKAPEVPLIVYHQKLLPHIDSWAVAMEVGIS